MRRTRRESLSGRIERLKGVVPTPGLVCGDFLSIDTKNPDFGVRSLLRRKDKWNCLGETETPVAVQIFE